MSEKLIPFNLFCPERDLETWQELCALVTVMGEYSYAQEFMNGRGYLWNKAQHTALSLLFDEQIQQDLAIL